MRTRAGLVAGVVVFLLGGVRVVTASFLIDNYSTGGYGPVIPPAQSLTVAAGVAGGDRMVSVDQTVGLPGEITMEVNTAASNAQYGSFNGADGRFAVGYGYDGAYALDPLNLDQSADSMFEIVFTNADFGTTLEIDVVYNGGTSASSQVLALLSGPHTFAIPFSDVGFAGVNWADIDQITYRAEAPPNGDYTITNFRTNNVPEPSSLALLGLFGLVGGLVRRRRS